MISPAETPRWASTGLDNRIAAELPIRLMEACIINLSCINIVITQNRINRNQQGVYGKVLIQTACAQCHSIDVAISQLRSRDEWTDVVSRMIGNGAHLSDDDYSLVIDYLSKHHGP